MSEPTNPTRPLERGPAGSRPNRFGTVFRSHGSKVRNTTPNREIAPASAQELAKAPAAPKQGPQPFFTTSAIVTTGVPQPLLLLSPKSPRLLSIRPNPSNAAIVYVGGAAVTAANGYPLIKTDTVPLQLDSVECGSLWIVGTAGDSVSVIG